MNNNNKIIHGDAAAELKKLDDESIDCIVTDPPYALTSEEYKPDKKYRGGFMNKEWDAALVSVDIWKECLRVLKAGAFAFIMCTPRQDILARQIVNLQDAGFKTNFSHITHTFASGFPKSANTSKLLQKRGIDKPELNGSYLGCQLKPATEMIIVVMKPLSEKSFVDQALKNGKGISWLDSCRIPFRDENDLKGSIVGHNKGWSSDNSNEGWKRNGHKDYFIPSPNEKGRFPANLIVSDDSLNDGKITKSTGGGTWARNTKCSVYGKYEKHGLGNAQGLGDSGSYSRYFDLDAWSRAQFIITPKASASERNKGLENEEKKDMRFFKSHNGGGEPIGISKTYPDGSPRPQSNKQQNSHPTVKPLKLMSYLITMGSRENDIILDPFCGSGTTCIAAHQLHRRYIGIELQKEYVDIANKRLEPYLAEGKITDF